MKHAGAHTLERLADLLEKLRRRPVLREKSPGSFYLKSTAFLHFHEDSAGIFADVKLDHRDYSRHRVSTFKERAELLKKIDLSLESGRRDRGD